MAAGSTVYNFEIALSNADRNVYESLSLRVARHSSETLEYLLCRVFAYCFEFTEGIEFTEGLNVPETPAIWAKDLTGQLILWIEIGSPSVEKIHKASKRVKKVVVYTHKNSALVLQELNNQNIYRAEEIEMHSFDPKFLAELAAMTERRNTWALSVSEGTLYLDVGSEHLSSIIQSHALHR